MNYKRSCPHVPRIYGKDIALLCEIVLDNETRDLFPDIKSPGNSLTSARTMPKREQSVKLASSFTGSDEHEPTPMGRLIH